LPKGSGSGNLTQREVNFLAKWMNNYPRKILNGRSAKQAVADAEPNYGMKRVA